MSTYYLDPKADLTFKRVFGEHPDLVISFLNALLPFKNDDEMIESVTYLQPEMVPENPLRKNSIVDVRCRDNRGRQFIVEMQMVWSPEFLQRVMFNSAKAYVRQLKKGENYTLLEPVYSLNIVNDVFEKDIPEYYHYYRMVHEMYSDKVIDGLHLVFVELPKFTPQTFSQKKMHVLWLRYLTEVQNSTREVSSDLLCNPDISKALSVVERSAYTEEQLLGYEKFWDIISTEKTYYGSALKRGLEEGMQQGLEQGMQQGLQQGRAEGLEQGRTEGLQQGLQQGRAEGLEQGLEQGRTEGLEQGLQLGLEQGHAEGHAEGRAEGILEGIKETARKLKSMGLASTDIQNATGLSEEEILKL